MRNTILTNEEIIQIIKNLKEEEKKAYDYLRRQKKSSKSDYATFAQIDHKKTQRIFRKLVEIGLAIIEGKGKATEYVLTNIDTIKN
jgi:predicted transcriptional regulator